MTPRAQLVTVGPRATPNPSRLRALTVAIAGVLGLAGCKAEGAPFACECDMLTDYDDPHRETVKVCAQNDRDAPSVARGCAQLIAPMPVQTCKCAPAKDAPPTCREGCLP